jgi:hypothetical protein
LFLGLTPASQQVDSISKMEGKWVAPSSGCQPCEQPADGVNGQQVMSLWVPKASQEASASLEHALASA